MVVRDRASSISLFYSFLIIYVESRDLPPGSIEAGRLAGRPRPAGQQHRIKARFGSRETGIRAGNYLHDLAIMAIMAIMAITAITAIMAVLRTV